MTGSVCLHERKYSDTLQEGKHQTDHFPDVKLAQTFILFSPKTQIYD